MSLSEAEAQCAALELLSLSDGCITNDNDVFLFGGQKVYRHFFDQHKDIELYSASEVEKMLGITSNHARIANRALVWHTLHQISPGCNLGRFRYKQS